MTTAQLQAALRVIGALQLYLVEHREEISEQSFHRLFHDIGHFFVSESLVHFGKWDKETTKMVKEAVETLWRERLID